VARDQLEECDEPSGVGLVGDRGGPRGGEGSRLTPFRGASEFYGETFLGYMEHTTPSEIDAILLAGTGTQSLPLKGTLSASPVAIWVLNA
jgi:hypothetical protein